MTMADEPANIPQWIYNRLPEKVRELLNNREMTGKAGAQQEVDHAKEMYQAIGSLEPRWPKTIEHQQNERASDWGKER